MRLFFPVIAGMLLAAAFAHAQSPTVQSPTVQSPTVQSSTATGVNNAFNPAISVNALLLGQMAESNNEHAYNQVDLQEAEIQVSSIVDPYWKANLVFAVHPAHEHEHAEEEEAATEADAHASYAWDVEVAYVDGTSLPGGFGLRLGKDYLPFGKHVPLHTHQFPFVRAPLAIMTFLGDHGLTETGVRVSHEIPLPWYTDVSIYGVDGRAEIFDGEDPDLAWGGRWANVWDVSETATFELSGSYLRGPQSASYLVHEPDEAAAAGDLTVWGVDATFKWISASRTKGPALTLTGEVVVPRPQDATNDPLGWYALAQYRFAPNWWFGLGAGAADLDLPVHEEEEEEEDHAHTELFAWEDAREYKVNLTWVPSEFSAVRVEAARYDDLVGDADDWLFSAQVNFTIGSHPAHLY
jgi:hypothetical protein